MKKIVLAGLFLLISTELWAYVDLPQGCWGRKEKPCSVRASQDEWIEMDSGSRVFAQAGASFVSDLRSDLKVLSGELWVESDNGIRALIFENLYEMKGHFWLKKNQSETQIRVFLGQLQSTDLAKTELIPSGFEKWWRADLQSLVKPIVGQEKIFRDWNRFLQLEKNVAASRISEYKAAWVGRAERGAQLYQAVVDRKIASAESRVELARVKQLKKRQEQDELREQFRKRFYNP